MQRTQVYFDSEILNLLREEAKMKKTTLAAVIRAKVEKDIKKKSLKTRKKNARDFLLDLEQLGKKLKVKGPKDLSNRIDEFVYHK